MGSQGRSPRQGLGAVAPHSAPAWMPGVYAQRLYARMHTSGRTKSVQDAPTTNDHSCTDAEPTKHTQPFTTGKGFGNRDKEFALLYKKADFFYKLSRLSDKERWLILEKFPLFARFVLTFSRQYSKIKIVCIID